MDEPAPWQVLNRQRIFTSGWINLDLWAVRLPDGTVVADHPVLDYVRPAVSVLPIGDDGRVLMIDHYRVITGTRGWELPAGRVDPGESVDEAAPRELMEETGHTAAGWSVLGQFHPSNGSSNQVFHVRVARRLTRVSEPTDRNETMALRWFSAPEIRDLVQANAIRDGLTLTALCWAMVRGEL
jgi:8-oxo-dGTP pyrophosphatase MutT (NUDIX family)